MPAAEDLRHLITLSRGCIEAAYSDKSSFGEMSRAHRMLYDEIREHCQSDPAYHRAYLEAWKQWRPNDE